MTDVHERSHRQYPHDMVLAAVWEQGYLTATADLRDKVSSGWVPELDHEARIAVLALIEEVRP